MRRSGVIWIENFELTTRSIYKESALLVQDASGKVRQKPKGCRDFRLKKTLSFKKIEIQKKNI